MKTTLTLLTFTVCLAAMAQERPPTVMAAARKLTDTVENLNLPLNGNYTFGKAAAAQYGSPMSVQLEVGTQGVGADFRYGIADKLSLRAGAGFVPVTVNNVFNFSGFASSNTLSAKFSNAHLLADYAPFGGGFRIVGGAGYFFQGDAKLLVTSTGTYSYGDIPISADQVGTVTMDVSWKGVAPYLGIGLLKSFPNNFFNFNLDIGTYYLKQPGVTVTGTGLLAGNSGLQQTEAGNLQDYRFLPVLQLNFNFRLK